MLSGFAALRGSFAANVDPGCERTLGSSRNREPSPATTRPFPLRSASVRSSTAVASGPWVRPGGADARRSDPGRPPASLGPGLRRGRPGWTSPGALVRSPSSRRPSRRGAPQAGHGARRGRQSEDRVTRAVPLRSGRIGTSSHHRRHQPAGRREPLQDPAILNGSVVRLTLEGAAPDDAPLPSGGPLVRPPQCAGHRLRLRWRAVHRRARHRWQRQGQSHRGRRGTTANRAGPEGPMPARSRRASARSHVSRVVRQAARASSASASGCGSKTSSSVSPRRNHDATTAMPSAHQQWRCGGPICSTFAAWNEAAPFRRAAPRCRPARSGGRRSVAARRDGARHGCLPATCGPRDPIGRSQAATMDAGVADRQHMGRSGRRLDDHHGTHSLNGHPQQARGHYPPASTPRQRSGAHQPVLDR